MRVRKKPIVVDAVQYVPGEAVEESWVITAIAEGYVDVSEHGIVVSTMESWVELKPYDYLMQGVKGEVYPCPKDVFEESYEVLDD